ncbi:MAG: hypothetical protein KC503_02710 [Myxococcales bacterium]|nr:hypothetical protein [Myxococcales bacterium]
MNRSFRAFGRIACALALALLAIPASAFASGYVRIPGSAGQRQQNLRIRFVRYTGGSSGRMIIDVKNVGKQAARFDPRGVYFVPQGDPEKAPQRLGAAGPLAVDKQGSWVDTQKLMVRPGKSVRVSLQVFCLDSHRSSPASSQKFSVANKLLPKSLRREITHGVADVYKANAAKARPAAEATPAAQSHVWKTRNKKWIKLQGERLKEK